MQGSHVGRQQQGHSTQGRPGSTQAPQPQLKPGQSAAHKAILEDNISKLRTNLVEIEKDDWKFETPRHTFN